MWTDTRKQSARQSKEAIASLPPDLASRIPAKTTCIFMRRWEAINPFCMLTRFAAISLFLALSFSGCKKKPGTAGDTQVLNPSPAPSAAAAPAATPAPTPAAPPIDQNAQVIVYGYHRFVEKVRRPDTEITPAAFEAQMKELKEKNIPVIGMQDFLAWKRGEKGIPSRAAIITLDDGWKSQYEVAWPILKKYEFPFTLFIHTEGIRGGHFAGGESMGWEHLQEMRDAGVDIQAHSATHQDLGRPYDAIAKKKLNPGEYQQWLQNETAGVKKILEDKLGIRVNAFAVPYGKHDETVRKVVMDAGYEGLFTVYGQPLTFGSPMDSLGRYLIEANKPQVFTTALNFGGASAGSGPAIASVNASNLQTQPAEGETVRTSLPLIKANLSALGPIDAGSVQMRVSGLGLVPATFDEKAQTVSYQVTQKLRDKTCTVIIGAKSRGKKVEASWTFSIDEGGAGGAAAASSPAKKK